MANTSSIAANNPRWLAPEVIASQVRRLHSILALFFVSVAGDGMLCQHVSRGWPAQEYTKAGDVFSFGVVLWELITWQLPWEELGTFQV